MTKSIPKKDSLKTYRVRWEIDIDADCAVSAAELALEIQRDPESTATVADFEVFTDECRRR